MPATIVMGGQWGDEGKGKLTDALAADADVVVRANGGSNAGHTIETERGVFKLHLIPSGILNPACLCVVGAGVVVDPGALLAEMDELRERGVDLSNLWISDRAHVVMPYHPMLDRLEEERRADDEIGTTLRGNGPAYADKAARHGLRISDLLDAGALAEKIRREIGEKNRILAGVYDRPPLDPVAVHQDLAALGERLSGNVAPSEKLVQDALAAGGEVVVECAQGAMLDIDYGSYPFVTSSSPTAAGACQGAGVAPTQVERVIGVYKAYSTRVGAGPLPTELLDARGEEIRVRGREYGTTTGRPRRIGWFDAVAARYVARLNGVTEIVLTLLDVLDPFDEIKVCTGYRLSRLRATDPRRTAARASGRERGFAVEEETIDHPPATLEAWETVTPVYETVPGWRATTTGARSPDDLPPAARAYVRFIEEALGAPVTMVGVGPHREQLVPLRGATGAVSAG